MRLTCNICILFLIFSALCGGIYAFTGFDLLFFLCLKNGAVYRSFLAVNAVAALFALYSLLVFKPFKGLK